MARAWLLTSANAARAIGAASAARGAAARCRPSRSAGAPPQAARAAGFADVMSADGDVGDLARLIATQRARAQRALLYLAGEDRAGDLAARLAAAGRDGRDRRWSTARSRLSALPGGCARRR